MDWIHLLALVYFCVVTPLASLGTVTVYVFVAAFLPAREDRRKENKGDRRSTDW